MRKVSFNRTLLLSSLMVWTLTACNSDGNQSSADNAAETAIDSTALETSEMPDGDDHFGYTYNYMEDGADGNAAAEADKTADKKSTPPKLKVDSKPVIYTVSQTDRPPLFTTECTDAKNPQRCSNNALANWARNSVKYPEADLAEGSDGLEYVTFVINKNGEVSSVSRVDSKIEACAGCSKAVLDAVLDMPTWQPAMLGGKPVNVMVTLPVRFKAI